MHLLSIDKNVARHDLSRMERTVRIAAVQSPEFLGNIEAAMSYAADVLAQAVQAGVQLLCFPECYLQGYLLDEEMARTVALDLSSADFAAVLNQFPQSDTIIVMGMIERHAGALYNSAIVVQNRSVIGRYRKAHLLRKESFFEAGTEATVVSVNCFRFGVNICCDTRYPTAAQKIADLGGSLIVCPANNMLPRSRAMEYKDVHNSARGERCRESGLWLMSSDVTGERDDCVGWGPTAVLNPAGQVVAQLPLEQLGLLIYDMPVHQARLTRHG
ncbi:carbon-nitrogen hydrolase family protein [Agrobacterium sp. NPDC090283]|uniref:carbon-nitrogen hydrolase family protein n=1 Tax=Agrobacterium sp. NPDC090283 TaxID=3363920 RepID=UPI00383ACD6A